MKASELRAVFMGTPEFATGTLQGLIDAGVKLIGVYTQPDRPKGRGKKMVPPPVKELAVQHDIPVFQPRKLRDPEAVAELQQLAPDLIVVVAYGQILPQSVLDIPRMGCINVHASLLPKYRGAAPINKAIIDGETVTGITTMLMDVGLDTGDMLIKKSLSIGPDETAGELHDRLAVLGCETMQETLKQVLSGTLDPQKQNGDASSYASMLKKENGLIDWSLPARELHNRVRGLAPWPGAFSALAGETLKISRTEVVEGVGKSGTIVAANADGVDVACGVGILRIGALQLPGKKMLPAADFLRGHQLTEGLQLG